jgi:exopolyphosphatase / guanosine-5'-triphosphate,3'-diphosphate pyrophosphatase
VTDTRVAAIDCGTNSIRLLIADLDPGTGRLEDLDRRMSIVRLGQDVDRTGRLAPEALERTFAACREYAAAIREYGVDPEHIRFVATSASRDAENREDFIHGVLEVLGVSPEVVTGDEEAQLSYTGATRELGAANLRLEAPYLVVDIGGGSTELVLGTEQPDRAVSMDIGSVRLHERHLHADPPSPEQISACLTDIDRHLDASPVPIADAHSVIGTSGTIKTLAAAMLELPVYDRDAIDGTELGTAETAAYVERLVAMTVAERRAIPSMHPGRADVIAAGGLIWSGVLARSGVPSYRVSEADILYGIASSLVES